MHYESQEKHGVVFQKSVCKRGHLPETGTIRKKFPLQNRRGNI